MHYRRHIRPVRPGYSFGLAKRVGTLGLVVHLQSDPYRLLLLSSSHVLNLRPDGKRYSLYQPSGKDRDFNEEPIAQALRYTKLHPYKENYTEAGLAEPFSEKDIDPEHPLGPIRGVCSELKIGQKLRKVGRTTGEVEGEVIKTDWKGWIRFRRRKFPFARQILINNENMPISLQGDSGSVWITDQGEVAAMNIAGCHSGNISISTPISRIFSLFDVCLPN
jgi:hypothetical protein